MFRRIVVTFAAGLLFGQQPAIDPPPVDETRLAAKLVDMAKPAAGERAVIVFDPTYYPGITRRLREELHRRGVSTTAIVEDTEAMIQTYVNNRTEHDRRRDDVIATLLPVFQKADIFYWMPARGYVSDLRWEQLTAQSKVRSVHFHWMLRFPGSRTNEQIVAEAKHLEKVCLETDTPEYSRFQSAAAAFLRGKDLHITTPDGTDLRVHIPKDQWFHLGNGDASKERMEHSRSYRDRMIEFPVGMFAFIPDAATFSGDLVVDRIPWIGDDVRGARFHFEKGRAPKPTAAAGEKEIYETYRDIGPDGDKIGAVFFGGTQPFASVTEMVLDIGSNWEMGNTNRATGMRRINIHLLNATVTAGDRIILRDGAWQWDALR